MRRGSSRDRRACLGKGRRGRTARCARTDRIALLTGDGGNVGLVIGEDGLLMIDGGYANRALDLQKAVAETDSHPVKVLFNTHWHGDHVGSNEMLGKAGVKIMAHQNAKFWLSQKVKMEIFDTTVEPLKPEGIPKQDIHRRRQDDLRERKDRVQVGSELATPTTTSTCSFPRPTCSIPATCFSAACIR